MGKQDFSETCGREVSDLFAVFDHGPLGLR